MGQRLSTLSARSGRSAPKPGHIIATQRTLRHSSTLCAGVQRRLCKSSGAAQSEPRPVQGRHEKRISKLSAVGSAQLRWEWRGWRWLTWQDGYEGIFAELPIKGWLFCWIGGAIERECREGSRERNRRNPWRFAGIGLEDQALQRFSVLFFFSTLDSHMLYTNSSLNFSVIDIMSS